MKLFAFLSCFWNLASLSWPPGWGSNVTGIAGYSWHDLVLLFACRPQTQVQWSCQSQGKCWKFCWNMYIQTSFPFWQASEKPCVWTWWFSAPLSFVFKDTLFLPFLKIEQTFIISVDLHLCICISTCLWHSLLNSFTPTGDSCRFLRPVLESMHVELWVDCYF